MLHLNDEISAHVHSSVILVLGRQDQSIQVAEGFLYHRWERFLIY